MIVKLLTEHHFEFLSLKEPAEARPSLHLSKCQIVGNLIHWLICIIFTFSVKHGSSRSISRKHTNITNILAEINQSQVNVVR